MQHSAVISIGLIKTVFESEHVPVLLQGEATHDAATRFVAQLVSQTTDLDAISVIVAASLPEDYVGDTLKEVPSMIAGAQRKGYDARPARPASGKRKPCDILAELFEANAASLFHDPLLTAYIELPTKDGHGVVNVGVESKACRLFLRELYFRHTRRAIAGRDLDEFLELLKARALFDSPIHPVFVRVGGDINRVCHDLGRDDGTVVEISGDGYKMTRQPRSEMVRTHGMQPLPLPQAGSAPYAGFDKFKRLASLDDRTWPLVLAFLIGAMRPNGPFACLAVEGEQGSGKSTICEMCKRVIDPSIPMRSSLPDNAQDLMIIASHRHVVVFDNLSGVKNDMSDALAALATKAGFEKRQLYTDGNFTRLRSPDRLR